MIELNYEKEAPPGAQNIDEPPVDGWADELNQTPPQRRIWSGPKGVALMIAGVALPSLFLALFAGICHERISMLLIKHPVETLLECVLAMCIPVGNFSVWSALCRNDLRFAMRRGIQNGLAIGGSILFVVVSVAAIVTGRSNVYFFHQVHSFAAGFAIISAIFLASMVAGIFLTFELREQREFKSAKMRTVIYSIIGVVLAVLGFVGAEAKSMYMRIAERMAFAGTTREEQVAGLKMLRGLNPEQDMRLECADARTVGLPGLFIPIDNVTQQQLYFAAFGKPFRDDRLTDLSGFSNDYLHRHVVGAMIPELSLVRSGMDGAINPDSLSSTINWTFVFKNTSYEDKEARAELSLPPGAVISNVTVWSDGQPINAGFAASGKAPRADAFTSISHATPAVVSDLGRGRTLLHCYPVKAQDQLKVRLTMVMPLKLDDATEANLALPRFIDTNFNVNGEHQIRLRSPERLSLKLDGLRESISPTKERVLVGTLKDSELSGLGLSVTVQRQLNFKPVAVPNPHSPGRFILQTIQQKPVKLPNHLIVVLDGSQNVKTDLAEIKAGLSALPSGITSSLVLASDTSAKSQEMRALDSGLAKLSESDFDGGQDNLLAVVKAASTAGETKNGAVLWIHGPQPTLNKELYVMAPYTQTPAFYELSLDNSVTDGNEFFKNHREIGPFAPVPRNGSIKHDLKRFVSKWQPGGVEYLVKLDEKAALPAESVRGTNSQAHELSSLHANEQAQQLIAHADYRKATNIAVSHRLVTPVSSAVVLADGGKTRGYMTTDSGDDPAAATRESSGGDAFSGTGTTASSEATADESTTSEATETTEAPSLQGATSGSIASESDSHAEYVTGINTSGTVRVNNLANLEALLNVLANGFEIVGAVTGFTLIVQAMVNKRLAWRWFGLHGVPSGVMVFIGVVLIVGALAVPGVINWFVASARDANLFS